jgi:hypothetical protein
MVTCTPSWHLILTYLGFVLTRFCICLLHYDWAWRIINFAIFYYFSFVLTIPDLSSLSFYFNISIFPVMNLWLMKLSFCNYKLSRLIFWMLFSHSLLDCRLTTDDPVYLILITAHDGCDRSAKDAYSSMAPIFLSVGGQCCPYTHIVFAYWIMTTFNTMVTSLLDI